MALKKKTPSPKKKASKASPPRRKGPARGKPVAPRRKPVKKAPKIEAVRAGPPENPQAKALAQKVAQLVVEKKATDVVILDVRGKTSYADYMVVGSGESDRQVSAMADHVHLTLKEQDGLRPIGQEGHETGQWVLLDYGEVVVHLFFNEARAFYDLEGLWADAPREKVA